MVSGKATASVDGKTVAEATEWEEIEGNVYFPPAALDKTLFSGPTDLHTTCGWKGEASYYTITVGGAPSRFLDANILCCLSSCISSLSLLPT
jgi:uncharacterized protein (DUF427 family)